MGTSYYISGAITAVFLVANIAGSLIAVVAFVAFINGLLSWFGGLVGAEELSIELIFGYVFVPLAWLMGVDYKVLYRRFETIKLYLKWYFII